MSHYILWEDNLPENYNRAEALELAARYRIRTEESHPHNASWTLGDKQGYVVTMLFQGAALSYVLYIVSENGQEIGRAKIKDDRYLS